MPTQKWLKNAFAYGYYSGNILTDIPDPIRKKEETLIGGSYLNVFQKAIQPFLKNTSIVMEIGPGKGSWSYPILECIPKGHLHTVDFQDVTQWLRPEIFNGRLTCHTIADNNGYTIFEDRYFDFCWSFGVLCHNNLKDIQAILKNIFPKMKNGAIAVHQYANWPKLDKYGWKKGGIPHEFKEKPDDKIWWPRNSIEKMVNLSKEAGWTVVKDDLELLERDSIIILGKNIKS